MITYSWASRIFSVISPTVSSNLDMSSHSADTQVFIFDIFFSQLSSFSLKQIKQIAATGLNKFGAALHYYKKQQ